MKDLSHGRLHFHPGYPVCLCQKDTYKDSDIFNLHAYFLPMPVWNIKDIRPYSLNFAHNSRPNERLPSFHLQHNFQLPQGIGEIPLFANTAT